MNRLLVEQPVMRRLDAAAMFENVSEWVSEWVWVLERVLVSANGLSANGN